VNPFGRIAASNGKQVHQEARKCLTWTVWAGWSRFSPLLSDALLVARVLADDDRHAFAELTRRHQSAVLILLRRAAAKVDSHKLAHAHHEKAARGRLFHDLLVPA
jgi:hypothetical protein